MELWLFLVYLIDFSYIQYYLQEPLICPAMNCDLACLHGYQLNDAGCPICRCRDPCEEVQCASPMEECRIVHVACVGEPCPPLPVCLPRLENPCPSGMQAEIFYLI